MVTSRTAIPDLIDSSKFVHLNKKAFTLKLALKLNFLNAEYMQFYENYL